MEALGYSFEMQDEQNVIEKLCNNLLVIQLNDDVVKLVVEIRKSKKIKLPDAIIAASAICNKATLITRNTSDFQNVHNDLIMVNPFEFKDS
jgi:predicted nucleic acid-binding protein